MLSLGVVYQNKQGFSLLELLLWLGIFSIICLVFISLLQYADNVVQISDLEDEILLHGRYGIEYIKSEIYLADRIIPIYKIKDLSTRYGNMFNFVILSITYEYDSKLKIYKTNYNYSTYYLRDDNLVRIAVNKEIPVLPAAKDFSGFNEVCSNVVAIDNTRLNIGEGTIRIGFTMGKGDLVIREFKTLIKLECPIGI